MEDISNMLNSGEVNKCDKLLFSLHVAPLVFLFLIENYRNFTFFIFTQVPNIYTADEKAEICEKMKHIDQQRERALQTDGSPAALFNLFVQICRDQLHIVVTMSPIGDAFRNRIRKFPALVNCCTIDWLQVSKSSKIIRDIYYLIQYIILYRLFTQAMA